MLNRLSSLISLIVMYSLLFGLGEPVLRAAHAQGRTVSTSDRTTPAQAQSSTAPLRVFLPFITAGASTQVIMTGGDNQTAQVGTTVELAPTVRVLKDGMPVAGARVDFVVASGGGQLTGSQQHTDAAGVASVGSWTMGTQAGSNTLNVVFAGQHVLTFTATGTPGPAATIENVTGDGGTTPGGSTRVLEARVLDVHGNAVSGHTVAWAVTSGSGLLSAAASPTNALGIATITWTLSATPGLHSVTATATGLHTSPLTFRVSVDASGASLTTSTISATPTSLTADGTSTATIRVQLKDVSGTNVTTSGGLVTLSTTAGAVSAVTDHQDGTYTATLTAPTTSSDTTITATLAGSPLTQTATVSFTAGAAATLVSVSGNGGSAVVGTQRELHAKVVDAFGNPVPGYPIQWAVTSGGGSMSVSSSTTNTVGIAAVAWTLGTSSGAQSATATASGLTGSPQTFTVTALAGAATQLAVTTQPSSSTQSSAVFPQQPAVQLQDTYGNVVLQSGVSVTAAIASGGGTLGGTVTATTDASGTATFNNLSISGVVGNRTLAFSAASLTMATSNAIAVTAGAATQLTLTTQPSATAQNGIALTTQPVLHLQDAVGNPVAQSGVVVSAAIATGGGTLDGMAQATTNAAGVATFTNLAITGIVGDRTLAFAATGLNGVTSTTITLTSGTPAQLVIITQPSNTARAGMAFAQQPMLEVQDASGNPVTQVNLTITASIATGGGTLGGTVTATTDTTGSATFTHLSIGGVTGNRTLAFSASDVTGATSQAITVTAGSAATLAFSAQPTTVIANAPITPAVQVSILDAYGNLVTGATDAVTIAIGTNTTGSTLAGTATVAASGGVASFNNLGLNKTGNGYTLAASSGALSSATSTAFNVIVGPLDHFLVEKFDGGAIENQLANTSFPVRVTAQDVYNNTVTTFTGTVNFTSTPLGAISAGSTSVAFTAGILSSHSITFGTPGTFTLTATNASKNGTSTSFDVQAPPVAVADGPATDSSPGQPYHAVFSTAANPQTFTLAAPGLLGNDTLGYPSATIVSFGGNSLGGSVLTYPAGARVSPLPGYSSGSLSVGGKGDIAFTPPDGFTGNYVFQYRLANVRGPSDATVTIAVGARPVAVNDTYTPVLVGNVPINTATSSQFRLAANDGGDAKTLNIVGQSNGTAVLALDSTFIFRPTPGFEGTASFTYTVANGFGTSMPATVSLTVANPIWFVQAGATAGGNGRYDAPFNSVSSLALVNNGTDSNPGANDRIFLYSGSYAGPLTLLSGQRVIGQGATVSLSSSAGVTWPADAGAEPAMSGTAPTLTSTNVTALSLANIGSATTANNLLRGFTIGSVGSTGTALSGTSFGTLTISEVGINTNGQALNLNTGTLSGSFTQVGSTGGTNNISLTNVTTSSTTVLGASADALSGATGDALVINGGNGSFTYAGSITNITALAVNITNKTGGSVTIAGDINPSAAGRGIAVTNNSTGTNTITFSGSAQKISSGTFAGVNLANNPGATISFTGGGLAITTTTGNGFQATGGSAVQISGSANTISSAGGIALNVQNTTIGANGLTFRSISANGGTNGIVLNNTGNLNGLYTLGTGTAGSGGTIQNTTGDAISLSSASNVQLALMNLRPSASGWIATNLGGTNKLERSIIDYLGQAPAGAFAFRVVNTNTNATVTLDGTTFQNKLDGTTAVSISTMGTSQIAFNAIDSNSGDAFENKYTNIFGSGIVIGAGDDQGSTAVVTATISNGKFINAPANGLNNLEMGANQYGTLVPIITNNLFDKVALPLATVGVININLSSVGTGAGRIGSATTSGLISGNTITNIRSGAGPTFAYDPAGLNGYVGIRVAIDNAVGGVHHKLQIVNNTITNLARQGILVSARNEANNVNVRIQGNTVGTMAAPVGASSRRGVEIETQSNAVMKVEVINNPSIVSAGSSGANASLALRSGVTTGANGGLYATVTGNTLSGTNASSTARFRAETTSVATNPVMCLDLRNNSVDAGKSYELINSVGTFNRLTSGNTGTLSESGFFGSVLSCTTPSF